MSRRRRQGPTLELKDRFGWIGVWVNPTSTKIMAMRWPSRITGGLVRAWTLGEPPHQPEPWQRGLER